MAKTKTATTRSAFGFVPGDVARADDFSDVHEQQNAARGDTIHNLLSVQAGGQGWGGGSELSPAGLGVNLPASGTTADVYRTSIYVDADILEIAVRTVATVPASSTASVIATLTGGTGTGTATHAHSAGATTTVNSTVATSTTGTGWILVEVDLRQDTGDPSAGTFDRMRLRTTPIAAASLGDPV